jgi:SprT-like zinc ribbon domain
MFMFTNTALYCYFHVCVHFTQAWAKLAHKRRPDVQVTTCHNYDIAYKYRYQCQGCSKTIGRHSKSVDTTRMVCGGCSGKLVLLKQVDANGVELQARTPSKFSLFVKEQFSCAKKALPKGSKHGDVMKQLSCMYKAQQQQLEAHSTAVLST